MRNIYGCEYCYTNHYLTREQIEGQQHQGEEQVFPICS